MPFETLVGGLELVIPTNSTTNWGTVVRNSTWTKINDHQHTGSGDGNPIPSSGIADQSITREKLRNNFSLTQQSQAPTGTTQDINWDDGSLVILDLATATGDVTLSLLNPLEGGQYRIKVVQGATARLLVWPTEVKFPQGEEPSQYSEPNTSFVVKLDYDGTDYLSDWNLDYR